MNEQQIAAVKQALEFIETTNKSSSFWLVPESNLNKTVTALRRILADHALDKMAENARELGLDYDAGWKDGYKHGAWASEQQPADEPVAVGCTHEMLGVCSLRHDNTPAQWGCVMCGKEFVPKTQWVGLTDEEIGQLVSAVWPREATPADFIRAIEAKLREKNGGKA